MRVAIVGGGVIGLSVAWRCAQRGLAVTVYDDRAGDAAAQVAAGMLAPVTELHYGQEPLLALNLESARRWPAFAAALGEASGLDPGYLACGTLAVARDTDDLRALDALHAYQSELGLPAERLSSRALRRREPALGTAVRGGLWVAGDHQIESRRLLAALRAALVAAGGRIVSQALGDRAQLDRLPAERVVVTAGWRSVDLLPSLPLRPVKGQILRLRATARAVLPRHVLRGAEVYVVPRYGEVVVGATMEEAGADVTVTAGAVAGLLRAACELVPGLAEAALVECAAGLRPGTPDDRPIIGAVDARTIVATGHFRHGILLAPITADAVAGLLTDAPPDPLLAACSPARFARQEVTACS